MHVLMVLAVYHMFKFVVTIAELLLFCTSDSVGFFTLFAFINNRVEHSYFSYGGMRLIYKAHKIFIM